MKNYPETYKEKTSNILEEINNQYQMTTAGKPITLSPNAKLLQNIPVIEISSFLDKLENEEKVISITAKPLVQPLIRILEAKSRECYTIELLPAIKSYFDKVTSGKQQKAVNTELKHTKPEQNIAMAENANAANDRLFWIEFDKINRKVILNDIIILAEPKPNSSAWQLISELSANPNKELILDELCSGDIHAAYRDLGFRKGIKDLFLEVGKGKIKFINPVTKERFDKLENKEAVRIYFKPQDKVSETATKTSETAS